MTPRIILLPWSSYTDPWDTSSLKTMIPTAGAWGKLQTCLWIVQTPSSTCSECAGEAELLLIVTKCHLCCSCHHSTVSCPPLAHCGRITTSVVPAPFRNTAAWKADGASEGFTFWVEVTGNLLFAEPYQISALHFNVWITVHFFSFRRLPNRPIINTPVVSTAIHSDGDLPPNLVEKPIIVEYSMLETEERTKPVCVFWNHSITYVSCFRAVPGKCLSSREVPPRKAILEENPFCSACSTGNGFLVE